MFAVAATDEESFADDLCAQIIGATQDAVIYADNGGIIRLWNVGAEAIVGHPASAALGQSLDLIIPQNLRDRHWDGWDSVMASGVTNTVERHSRYPHSGPMAPARRW